MAGREKGRGAHTNPGDNMFPFPVQEPQQPVGVVLSLPGEGSAFGEGGAFQELESRPRQLPGGGAGVML